MNELIIFGAQYLYIIELAAAVAYFLMQPKARKTSMITLSVIFLPSAYILDKIATIIYVNPRPFVVGHFTPMIAHAADNGFPSDHMLLGSVVAMVLFMYNKKIGLAAWAIALMVGASRVAAGVHHWVDIVGSAMIAIVTMWLVEKYMMPQLAKTELAKKMAR